MIYLFVKLQLQGKKKWILKPPPECFFECDMFEISTVMEKGKFSGDNENDIEQLAINSFSAKICSTMYLSIISTIDRIMARLSVHYHCTAIDLRLQMVTK